MEGIGINNKEAPIRGPGASTNSVSHPDRPSGVMTLPDRARCKVASRARVFFVSWLRGQTARQSPIRIKASGRPPMAGEPGPLARVSCPRKPSVPCRVQLARSQITWLPVAPGPAPGGSRHGRGRRNTSPSRADGGCDGVQSDLVVLSQPLSWLAVAKRAA